MTSGTTRTAYKRAHRVALPFSTPADSATVLDATQLLLGDEIYENEDVGSVEASSIPGPASLEVRIDCDALRAIQDEWNLKSGDLEVAAIVEARMLNLMDAQSLDVPWSDLPTGVWQRSLDLPEWAQAALGRSRLTVRVYLILATDQVAGDSGRATAKGSVLSSWNVTIDVPETVHWFTPRLLNDENREKLQRQTDVPISPSTLMFVVVEDLLSSRPVSDAVTVYLEPEVAHLLDRLRPGPALRMLESRITFDVLNRIFDALIHELVEGSAVDIGDTAAFPLVQLLANEMNVQPEIVLEKLRGSPTDIEAVRSHLQKANGLLGTAKTALRGDSQ